MTLKKDIIGTVEWKKGPCMIIAGISIHYLDLILYHLLWPEGNLMVPKWIAGKVSNNILS